MAFSYFIGFLPTIISTLVFGVVCFIWLFRSRRNLYKILDGFYSLEFKDVLIPIMKAIPLAASSFLLIYPILNLVLQIEYLNLIFFIGEFETSIFPLRISSLLIGIFIIRPFIKNLKYLNEWKQGKSKPTFSSAFKKTYKEFSDLEDDTESEDVGSFFYWIFFQYSIYSIIVIFLWIFSIFHITTLLTSILNWGIFFIIDDWAIFISYAKLLEGNILRPHRIRILIFNILLILGLAVELILSMNLIFSIVIIIILYLLVGGTYESQK